MEEGFQDTVRRAWNHYGGPNSHWGWLGEKMSSCELDLTRWR